MQSLVQLAENNKQRQFTIVGMEDLTRIVFETNTEIPQAALTATEMTMSNPMIDVLKPVSFSRIDCEHVVGYCNCADRGKEALGQLRKMFPSGQKNEDLRCEQEARVISEEVFPIDAVIEAQYEPARPVKLEEELDELDFKTLQDLLPGDMLEEMMLTGDVAFS